MIIDWNIFINIFLFLMWLKGEKVELFIQLIHLQSHQLNGTSLLSNYHHLFLNN